MSPLSVRRFRAERLLREDFEGLRARVIASVRGRLRASAVNLDASDLDACYAMAWQGLYAAVLDGEQIANPAAWLSLVAYRRAIDEHRARARLVYVGGDGDSAIAGHNGDAGRMPPRARPAELAFAAGGPVENEHDLAAALDDRVRLRQLFEALRGRLSTRELQAATLCYLQGLPRSEAAARMGVSEARMRKLMEGHGPGRPGVAGKVGALVATIRDGQWCHEQGSLMRALAYGILDPNGERYQLALMHHSQCPACRAYVVSLRGLAAVLPPVFLPGALAAGVLAGVGEGLHGAGVAGARGGGTGSVGGSGVGAGSPVGTGAGMQAGQGVGGALSGAAGAGGAATGAGGGWLLTGGPLTAKLAVGCVLALGVGAGCVALGAGHRAAGPHRRHATPHGVGGAAAAASGSIPGYQFSALEAKRVATSGSTRGEATAALTRAERANREFGPEALASVGSDRALAEPARAPAATSASISEQSEADTSSADPAGSTSVSGATGAHTSSAGGATSAAGDSAAAEREFAPG